MGEYHYSRWNLLASKASPSAGSIDADDGYSCNNKVGEGKGGRFGLQCLRGKRGAILGKTMSFQ
ncbi:hypothetical protein PVL29_007950 [Vitis rotundifolia]|uniref:Uncharacterized protein n=1 Tax=Vitis rotundifolia TaxID=103349 RepID=A0AA39DXI1_VITRO|nr:hypothetical protein PVL29_007950 [Vitis rotundifolia]